MRFESDKSGDLFWKKRMVRMLQSAGAKRMVALEDRDNVVAMLFLKTCSKLFKQVHRISFRTSPEFARLYPKPAASS